ncbi:MAG: hypothetical protein C0595_05690, partial [Marinilabiliales bacterium]
MKKNKIYGLISIGIMIGVLFPQGLQNLILKIFERILFNSNLDIFIASGISALIGLILTILIFKKLMNYFTDFDYSKKSEIKKALIIGIFINISFLIIWFFIPIIDSRFGESYTNNLKIGYEILHSNIFLSEVLINGMSSLICYVLIIIIIFKKVNTV